MGRVSEVKFSITNPKPSYRGQTLPLFALILPALLLLMALGLDGAQTFLERRDAQGAADLAALSGAQSLPGNPTKATNEAFRIASENGYPSSIVTVTTPYGGDPSRLEVVIDSGIDTFFMSILGLFDSQDHSTVAVSARAVAQAAPGTPNEGDYVLYALQPCGSKEDYLGIIWPGNDNVVEGSVHSEGGIYISGNFNQIRPQEGETDSELSVTCVGTGGSPEDLRVTDKYPYTESGDNPALSDGGSAGGFVPADCTGTEPPGTVCRRELATPDIPFYDEATKTLDRPAMEAACTPAFTRTGSSWDISTTLQPGVYCLLDGKMFIKAGTQIPDGATFFAREIEVADSNLTLTKPYLDGILMYATTTEPGKGVIYSGNWSTFEGNLYSPLASSMVSFSGENNTLIGALVGYHVVFNGNHSTLIGRFGSDDGSPPKIGLVE